MRKTKRITNKKKILFLSLAVILIASAGGAHALYSRKENAKKKSTDVSQNNPPASGINLDPPTEEEKRETENHKQELKKKLGDGNITPTPQPDSQAAVIMTYATYTNQGVEVGGFVSNIFEDGGTCTLTLTKGSLKATGTSQGFADVNKTTCQVIIINRNQLDEPGEWTAVLSYKSSKAEGSSSPKTISVP